MTLQIIWFVLWGVLWAVYFLLDGFDLGAGVLYGFLAKSEEERSLVRRAIGPTWDGNEVWLLTAGGATFAAFPTAYASLFSFLYTALFLVLFGLILRGVSLEFRAKGETAAWKRTWDAGLMIGSLLPAVLFGVAFGNLFRGLPFDAAGWQGSLLALLNPYALLTGVFFLLLFLVHGALWLAMRTAGEFSARALKLAGRLWWVLLVTALNFLVLSWFQTDLAGNYLATPWLFAVPGLAVLALLEIKAHAARRQPGIAFAASGLAIVLTTATGLIGLYPRLISSRLDPAASLTIFNASSSPYTLQVMTYVALAIPFVLAYIVYVWWLMDRGKIRIEDTGDRAAY
jgi:cytochrome d ubiquinol oxidase subunit II